jgi:hypothetical protein
MNNAMEMWYSCCLYFGEAFDALPYVKVVSLNFDDVACL